MQMVNETLTIGQFMDALPLIGLLLFLVYLLGSVINLLDWKWRFNVGVGVVVDGKCFLYGANIIDRKRFLIPFCQKAYLLRPISNSIPEHWVSERYLLKHSR